MGGSCSKILIKAISEPRLESVPGHEAINEQELQPNVLNALTGAGSNLVHGFSRAESSDSEDEPSYDLNINSDDRIHRQYHLNRSTKVEEAKRIKDKIIALKQKLHPLEEVDLIRLDEAILAMHEIYKYLICEPYYFNQVFETDTYGNDEDYGYVLRMQTQKMIKENYSFCMFLVKIMQQSHEDKNYVDPIFTNAKQVFLKMKFDSLKMIEWFCSNKIGTQIFKEILAHPSSSNLLHQSFCETILNEEFRLNILELILHRNYDESIYDYTRILKDYCAERSIADPELRPTFKKMLYVGINLFNAYLQAQPEIVTILKDGRDILSFLFENLGGYSIISPEKELLEQKIKSLIKTYTYRNIENHDIVVMSSDNVKSIADFVQVNKSLFPVNFRMKCQVDASDPDASILVQQVELHNKNLAELLAEVYQDNLVHQERSYRGEPGEVEEEASDNDSAENVVPSYMLCAKDDRVDSIGILLYYSDIAEE